MNENEIEVPVYLITGFLESGKTSFLNFTMAQEYFQIDETTLLINTEEGEEAYDEKWLSSIHTVLENVEEQEDFTPEKLRSFQRKYRPERVILEYNPLWGMQDLFEMQLPKGWGIVQQIVLVDGSTFQIYLNNMKSLFTEMSRTADMVLINRCTEDLPLANFRRSIKVVNPGCDVQFMNEAGQSMDIFQDTLPYDLEAEIINIEDIDFGIFFIDLTDNPKRYEGRKVRFKGKVIKSREAGSQYFLPARSAMTCCADDMQYIGYLCKSKDTAKLTEGSWVEVTARVDYKFVPMAQETEPVFQAITLKSTEAPAVEDVYFN
ncbi:MAG: GTP-binding protein [Eubacteriales bacterium]|nr:GTP-binding protein [Eubacteriales bacterium]